MMSVRYIHMIVFSLAAAAILNGCSATLPTYPRMPDDAALRLIAERLDSVRTVSAAADLTLTASSGRTVRLDGAFIASPPTRARLRAWKFGSPVLDLTVLPGAVWLYAPDPPGSAGQGAGPGDLSRTPAANIAPALELLSGAYFQGARPLPEESTAQTLAVIGPALGRDDVRCEIDRATLTPRRFRLGSAPDQGELLLDRYTVAGAIVWPRGIRFRGPDGEIHVRLRDLELNIELPGGAFNPPGRARLMP